MEQQQIIIIVLILVFLVTPVVLFAFMSKKKTDTISGIASPVPGKRPPPGAVPGAIPGAVPGNLPPTGPISNVPAGIIDITNPPAIVNASSMPSVKEIAFQSKAACQSKMGVINWVTNAKLLTCDAIVPFGQPESPIFRELDQIQALIDNGTYKPANEKDKLAIYFSIVYPNADPNKIKSMSDQQLIDWYQHLELYYTLPAAIMPATPITRRRQVGKQFYRVPEGVILDQDPDRLGEVGNYLEVIRFGPMYNFFTDPSLFVGTYYYPAKGSGLYLPLGRTLVAYNKVHAMKLLNSPNSQIVIYGGRDFQSFLSKDSGDPKYKDEAFVSACVANKKATANDPSCLKIFNYFSQVIKYKPSALDNMIAEMCAGKCLRYETRSVASGQADKKTLVYYGCGDTGDKFLAQMARNRGYNTLQFLREAQMELNGDAVVGNEIVHLVENVYSSTALVRLDPFKMPLYLPAGSSPELPVNYLLDQKINGIDVKAVINTEFQPYRQKLFDINVIVDERNTNGNALKPV
jgi:hypothetical protein